jgi:hypothetical protein
VFVAAGEKLQQELGDLELAVAETARCRLLMALPHSALLQLLSDNRTRVASDNTVFYVIGTWWGRQQKQQAQDAADSQQLIMAQKLLKQIRMKVRAAWLTAVQLLLVTLSACM